MPPRKSRAKTDRKKFNKCAYCRNHQEDRLAKGHRGNCKYNTNVHMEKCKDCKKNHRKTENMQKYREKKERRLDDSNVTSTTEEEEVAILEASFEDLDIFYDSDNPSFNEEHVSKEDL